MFKYLNVIEKESNLTDIFIVKSWFSIDKTPDGYHTFEISKELIELLCLNHNIYIPIETCSAIVHDKEILEKLKELDNLVEVLNDTEGISINTKSIKECFFEISTTASYQEIKLQCELNEKFELYFKEDDDKVLLTKNNIIEVIDNLLTKIAEEEKLDFSLNPNIDLVANRLIQEWGKKQDEKEKEGYRTYNTSNAMQEMFYGHSNIYQSFMNELLLYFKPIEINSNIDKLPLKMFKVYDLKDLDFFSKYDSDDFYIIIDNVVFVTFGNQKVITSGYITDFDEIRKKVFEFHLQREKNKLNLTLDSVQKEIFKK